MSGMSAFIRSTFGVDRVAYHRGSGGELWQGGLPEIVAPGSPYAEAFDVLVLCAKEIQPDLRVDGLEVIHCPLDDDYDHMPVADMMSAVACSQVVSRRLKAGARVLSTCHHGRNRSGLVSAMSIVRTFGVKPSQAIRMVRNARRYALQNPQFLMFLMAGER